jgi:hypothetical protein
MALALPPPFLGGRFWVPCVLSLGGYALTAGDSESEPDEAGRGAVLYFLSLRLSS